MKQGLWMIVLGTALAVTLHAGDKEDLESAIKKLADAGSYTFKMETKTESDNEHFPAAGETKLEGKFQKEVGLSASTDNQEIIRVGKKTVSRPKSIWRVEPEEEDQARRGFRPGGPGGWVMPRSITLPHEDLGAWNLKFVEKKSKDKVGDVECDVFQADFDDDACKSFLPFQRMMERMGGSGEFKGTIKAFVTGEGQLVRYDAQVTCTLSINGNDLEVKIHRTLDLSSVGSTTVEIPKEVKDLLN